MAQAERNGGHPARNPLIWISLVVVALVLFILFGGGRPSVEPAGSEPEGKTESLPATEEPNPASPAETTAEAGNQQPAEADNNDSARLMAPGQEARDYIRQLREQGPPWPFDGLMQKASAWLSDGRLADAWLLYFFAAREGHVEAMMTLAEMSDPNQFAADSNLLDRPEPVQAYKWYNRALAAGFEPARERLTALRDWAEQAAAAGDRDAQILMLNFQ